MRIKSIAAHPLQYPEPHHNSMRHITLARVEADDGTVGWGECISQFPESAIAVKTVVERGIRASADGRRPDGRGAALQQVPGPHLVVWSTGDRVR